MASNADFQEYIRQGKLAEALSLALSEVVQLQITTTVVQSPDLIDPNNLDDDRTLKTQINMVDGQITSKLGQGFTGAYRPLRQFHLEQVKEGSKTIQSNLKSLQKLFRLLAAMRQHNLISHQFQSELAQAEQTFLTPAPPPPEEVNVNALTSKNPPPETNPPEDDWQDFGTQPIPGPTSQMPLDSPAAVIEAIKESKELLPSSPPPKTNQGFEEPNSDGDAGWADLDDALTASTTDDNFDINSDDFEVIGDIEAASLLDEDDFEWSIDADSPDSN